MFLETINPRMENDAKALLVDGWLSPRMMKMLTITAGIIYDLIGDNRNVVFEPGRPTPLSEGSGVSDISIFEYIPSQVFHNNPEGIYKSFRDGWHLL